MKPFLSAALLFMRFQNHSVFVREIPYIKGLIFKSTSLHPQSELSLGV